MERWLRLAHLGRAELSDRLRQYLSARSDWFRSKLGIRLDAGTPSSVTHTRPRFFFSPEAVPSLGSLLERRLPGQPLEIVERAEQVCRHRFDLLGYRNLDYGAEIDWHRDVVHGKQAPRKPWFKIRYLDFEEAGDARITWELNRHQHLVTLAKAYRLTGDSKFASELFRQWEHWHRENPYPIGINWASSLEVGFRSLSWLWMHFLLEGSPVMPPDFRSQWLQALGISGRHIERYLSTYFSPNTHLLGEGVALFFIGTLCPEIQHAERWKLRGWEIVLREAERQVRADGLHFEQSLHYHVYALDFFLHAAVLATLNDVAIPPELDHTLQKMLDVLCRLSRAGSPPQLGDDDGGRVFDGQRNQSQHMLDPLSAGAVLFGRGDFKRVCDGLREETLWLLGEQGAVEFDRVPMRNHEWASAELEGSGLYLMASPDTWGQLVIDAGPQGALTAGHGHADALSVTANQNRRRLLIDCGTFEYVGSNSERDALRGTPAHNTLTVDGKNQAEPNGPFAWKKLPNVKAESWITGKTFDLFAGSHDGYCRLSHPVVHRRWVFSLKSRFWFIRDMALGEGTHRLDIAWHLSPDLSESKEEKQTFLDLEGRGIRVVALDDPRWSRDMRQEWWSPVYGRKERLDVLHFSKVAALPAEAATLFIPVTAPGASRDKLTRVDESGTSEATRAYRYETPEEKHYLFFAGGSGPWKLGPWSSDADFLYWGSSRDGARKALICCNATYVTFRGQKIISCARRTLCCEIINAAGQVEVFPPDGDAAVGDVAINEEFLRALPADFEPTLINQSAPPK
jgi:hypothetical protein